MTGFKRVNYNTIFKMEQNPPFKNFSKKNNQCLSCANTIVIKPYPNNLLQIIIYNE